MGTRAEAEVPLSPSIDPPVHPDQSAALRPSTLSVPENGSPTDALSSPPPGVKDTLPLSDGNRTKSDALQSSAAAFVEGGIQEACEDSCSICLEPFCESDPATVTSCKHAYHLQCILEWAQRSKECPMCWQCLSFEDPNSQELFDAIEQERSPPWMRHSAEGLQYHQVPAFANYADFEERIMQHLAHQLARRGPLRNRMSSLHGDALMHPSGQALLRTTRAILEQPVQEARQPASHSIDATFRSHSGISEPAVHEPERERRNVASDTTEENQPRSLNSDISSLSESLKSRFLVASSKWKEALTKTTHGFKEKWRARTNSSPTTDFRARAQGVSADAVRQAIRRIAPDSLGKEIDAPTTSSSCARSGRDEDMSKAEACSPARCGADNHSDGVATSPSSLQTPGEAV